MTGKSLLDRRLGHPSPWRQVPAPMTDYPQDLGRRADYELTLKMAGVLFHLLE